MNMKNLHLTKLLLLLVTILGITHVCIMLLPFPLNGIAAVVLSFITGYLAAKIRK